MHIAIRLLALLSGGFSALGAAAERINHEGRILGDQVAVSAPIQFNARDTAVPPDLADPTKNADRILETLQIMPRDSAWNEDISARPLLGNSQARSDAMIAMIRSDLSASATSNRHRLVVFQEMNFVLVPDSQPLADIRFVTYPDDSDYNGGTNPIARWPVPSIMPIETWPTGTGALSLDDWQRDIDDEGGDRHSIVVRPGAVPRIFETWQARLTGNTPAWEASNGAIFPLDSNAGRTPGYTSGDAAGLPMFPALVRYDECQRGVIEHAMRIVVKRSRRSYLYPASHQAGSTTHADVPAMGQRVRLKSSFVIPASWSAQERAVAVALKKYGALVADNGGFFSVSICPDDRWPAGCWDHLSTNAGSDHLDINHFEVIETTGETGGPRSAGAPTCAAGADQSVSLAAGAALTGSASGSGLTTRWELYPTATTPGTVAFGDAGALNTTATFSAHGSYILRLKASDGIHTPAYDAVVITVGAGSNPVPTLSAVTPLTAVQNSGAMTVTVLGTGFVPASRLTWSGRADLPAITASATQLTVGIPAGYLSTPGIFQLVVMNPATGGGTSSSQTFTVTPDLTAPVISALAAGSVGTGVATISWTTDEAASSQVDYGTTVAYGSSTSVVATPATTHSTLLSGLSANTTYHFRVRSSDAASNAATSPDGTFTTTSAPPAGGGGSGDSGGGGGCGLGAVSAMLVLGLGFGLTRRTRSSSG